MSRYPFIGEQMSAPHPQEGLYDPRFDHDGCGVAFVARIGRSASPEVADGAATALVNLGHRGAQGADPDSGDGAGILIQLPDLFLRRVSGIALPAPGTYGVGMTFLPADPSDRSRCEAIVADACTDEGLRVIGWRDVPIDASAVGATARHMMPAISQLFVAAIGLAGDALERRLYVLRRVIERRALEQGMGRSRFHLASLSSRTLIYKGMLTAAQLARFYPDLGEQDMVSSLALVHARFSTNVLPRWDLAQPFRLSAHNGEINTLSGNANWMRARQAKFKSPHFGDDMPKLRPVVDESGSDSSQFDNVLELLTMSGRSIEHAVMMMIPEAWHRNPVMDDERRAFYEFHSSLMEPWDGPAAIAFTDGRLIGATLDRNGLRPGRYVVTDDDLVVMASEAGVLSVAPEKVKRKGRLQPGKMFLVDTAEGRIISDKEIKKRLASRQPYGEWLTQNQITLDQLPEPVRVHASDHATILARQRAFGYTDEDLKMIIEPMAAKGEEPVGSMGTDTPLACLSDKPQPLFNYFKQLFAQVTNPPIDPIREEMVMSLISYIGTERNILDETPQHCHTLKLPHPILTNRDLEKLRRVSRGDFLATTLPMLFAAEEGARGLERGLDQLCRRASLAIKSG